MYHFLLNELNIDFAAVINDGVKPTVRDEDGNAQFFVVHEDGSPNEIISLEELKKRYEGKPVESFKIWH